MSDTKEQALLSDKGLEDAIEKTTAPRVTRDLMEQRIVKRSFQRLTPTLTHCIITLNNGYSVTGESACVNEANYNEDIGNRIAFDNAFAKLWPLFGFLLAEDQHRQNS